MTQRRALVAGPFTFGSATATAGDLLAADVVRAWLRQAGVASDLALRPGQGGGVRWDAVRAESYSDLVLVGGPVSAREPFASLRARFSHCRTHGLNLTMPQPVEEWQPFDRLLERASDRAARADIALASRGPLLPVVGFVRDPVGRRGADDVTDMAIARIRQQPVLAAIDVDLHVDATVHGAARNAAAVESVIARTDALVTTQLAGLVLAIKHGVPAIVVDRVMGGGEVARQASVLGWPHVATADQLEGDPTLLDLLLADCLGPRGPALARTCRQMALVAVDEIRREFLDGVRATGPVVA